jgi:hypothetical protein
MSYSVSYVVDVTGSVFNAEYSPWGPASTAEIEELETTGSLWNGEIPSAGLTATAELTGIVTLIWLSTKYSVFLAEPETTSRVLRWEQATFGPLQTISVARLDEFLLEQWEAEAGELWFRDPRRCERFWGWLATQQKAGWKLLQGKPIG